MRVQSTILKQMRLLHVGGYTDEERDGYREIVYANLVRPSLLSLSPLSIRPPLARSTPPPPSSSSLAAL